MLEIYIDDTPSGMFLNRCLERPDEFYRRHKFTVRQSRYFDKTYYGNVRVTTGTEILNDLAENERYGMFDVINIKESDIRPDAYYFVGVTCRITDCYKDFGFMRYIVLSETDRLCYRIFLEGTRRI